MNFRSLIVAAAAAVTLFAGGAHASTLSGSFSVAVCNTTNVTSAQSQATSDNYLDCISGNLGTKLGSDSFIYDGDLDFGTFDGSDSTTIAQWLATGGGTLAGLDVTVGGLQLSSPDITKGTATTTFFFFTANESFDATTFMVGHDDGFAIYEDLFANLLGGDVGPTSFKTTMVYGYSGGRLGIIYVATNGDPSVLKVNVVPLPAAAWMLMAGLGGLAAVKRRRKA